MSLWEEARKQFLAQLINRGVEAKVRDQFFSDTATAQDARKSCSALQADSDRKYESKWKKRILDNIDFFVSLGNEAMTAAPETVGLAWFAVTQVLNAIQNNYKLYSYFGKCLDSITDMLVLICKYDQLYHQRKRASKDTLEDVGQLFKKIKDIYVAILDFGFFIRTYLDASMLRKWGHALKSAFGATFAKLNDKMDTIDGLKSDILESSQLVFQNRTVDDVEAVRQSVQIVNEGVLSSLEKQREMNEMMVDFLKASKPKNIQDLAVEEFERNKKALYPLPPSQSTLERQRKIQQRYPDTCKWIFEEKKYTTWLSSQRSSILWLSGETGSGKSTVLSAVGNKLMEDYRCNPDYAVIFVSCAANQAALTVNPGEIPTSGLERVLNTIIFQVYELATSQLDDALLLQRCNEVFTSQKSRKEQVALNKAKGQGQSGKSGKDEASSGSKHRREQTLMERAKRDDVEIELADAIQDLAIELKKKLFIIVDGIDAVTSSKSDAENLASSVQDLLTKEAIQVHILLSSRQEGAIFSRLSDARVPHVSMNKNNRQDIGLVLSAELENMPGWSAAESRDARNEVLEKTASIFKYLTQVAIPFLRQPFERPLRNHLKQLPDNLNETYSQALRQMAANYKSLLKIALVWTLLANGAVTVDEIMDTYTRTYLTKDAGLNKNAYVKTTASGLRLSQMRDAAGPFLEIDQEGEESTFIVKLKDSSAIRHFCLDHEKYQKPKDANVQELCSNCRADLQGGHEMLLSEKVGHLDMAITILQHLNSPLFQQHHMSEERDSDESSSSDSSSTRSNPSTSSDDSSSRESDDGSVASDAGKSTRAKRKRRPAPTGKEEHANINGHGNDTDGDDDDDDDDDDNVDDNNVDDNDEWMSEDDSDVSNDDNKENDDNGSDEESNDDSEDSDDTDDNDTSILSSDGSDDKYPENDPEWISDPSVRYEIRQWFFHVRQAERLLSKEDKDKTENARWGLLQKEVDKFINNPTVFKAWKRIVYTYSDRPSWKPLHVAAYHGLVSLAERLIEKGGDPNKFSEDGFSALHLALENPDNLEMVKFLLERGADPNLETDDSAVPALPYCFLFSGTIDYARVLIQHGASTTKKGIDDSYAIHWFAERGTDPDILDLLLDHTDTEGNKVDINVEDDVGETPLHKLMSRSNIPLELLRAFVRRGADINKEDQDSERPLYEAAVYGEDEAINILLNGTGTPLEDIDDENKWGWTALHAAASEGYEKTVDLLINHGADPGKTDKRHRTPLFFACWGANDGTTPTEPAAQLLLNVLIEKGHDINSINRPTLSGRTPLREAAGHGFVNVVNTILHKITDVAIVNRQDDRKGHNALHRAALHGRAVIVEALLHKGADPLLKDKKDKTALNLAAEQWTTLDPSDFEQTICMLVDYQSDAAALDKELILSAAMVGSVKVLEKLLDAKADLGTPDEYGWTPLLLAQQYQRMEVVEFLSRKLVKVGPRPTAWKMPQSNTAIDVSGDGLELKYNGKTRVCILSDHPIPAGLSTFYYEIKIGPKEDTALDPGAHFDGIEKATEETSGESSTTDSDNDSDNDLEFALGFCTSSVYPLRWPGWSVTKAPAVKSWGWNAEDGGLYSFDNDEASDWADEYTHGDTVGCGVDFERGTVFFTMNGKKLNDERFENVRGRLFPVIGLKDGVSIATNFGQVPFQWIPEFATSTEQE